MSTAPAENRHPSARLTTAGDAPHLDHASFHALVYAAETMIQVDTRATPYVRTLDLASRADLGMRSR